MYLHTCTYIQVHTNSCIDTHKHTRIVVKEITNTSLHLYLHHTHTHTHTYTHTHTHTHTSPHPPPTPHLHTHLPLHTHTHTHFYQATTQRTLLVWQGITACSCGVACITEHLLLNWKYSILKRTYGEPVSTN